MISDLVLSRELPAGVTGSLAAYAGCIAGAVRKEEYIRLLEKAGFRDIRIVEESRFDLDEGGKESYAAGVARSFNVSPEEVREAAEAVLSIRVFGRKPG